MSEAWLTGPIEGIPSLLLPAAHALVQARDDVAAATAGLGAAQLWARPGGAASIGFHPKHLAGATDRLLTYARGEALSDAQRAALAGEGGTSEVDAVGLNAAFASVVEAALTQLRAASPDTLLHPRKVGRAGLPSTILGLVFHAAEHAARHAGQVVTTAKVVRGTGGQHRPEASPL